jgi:hypothetical protein
MSSSLSWSSPSPSSSSRSLGNISNQTLARMLVVVVVIMVILNIVYLVPQFPPIHENHYFFEDEAHMYRGGNNNIDSNNGNDNVNTRSKFKNTTTAGNNNIAAVDNNVYSESADRQYIQDLLIKEAEIKLTPEMEKSLPTMTQIRKVFGPKPRILGLESCSKFRDNVPALERMLGASGMFNTGTNLVTHLLKQNCEIPERREKSGEKQSKESYGMRWQVPWVSKKKHYNGYDLLVLSTFVSFEFFCVFLVIAYNIVLIILLSSSNFFVLKRNDGDAVM